MRVLRRAGRQVTIAIVDDLDGTQAGETVAFALDGEDYEIDLSTKNADVLRTALMPYLDRAKLAYLEERFT
jgi:ABC-type proline/glycine betaine transport system substrate-binding protein